MSAIDETPSAAPQNALLASQNSQSPSEYLRAYMQRVRSGDLGTLPIVFGLVLIAIIFQTLNSNFLTANNLVNLLTQMASITAIAYGVVFVLLLGEIDLSVGYVGGTAAVVMVLLLRPPGGVVWWVGIGAAILIGLGIGLLHGFIITTFQVPSFIVTLAGLLAWNGAVLLIIGGAGTVIIQDPVINGIANSYLPPLWGWIAAIVFIGGYALTQFLQIRSRQAKGLAIKPMPILLAQVIGLAIIVFIIIAVANSSRFEGVPSVGVLLVVLLAGLTYLAQNTRFGRYVYAVGGNKEASRRAGIRVERIRIYVFMISSTMAAIGGIIAASRLRSVATNTGGGDILLNSIASAVIGGTSLFGGRGSISSAVLGALVIASVSNGMGLLGLSAGVQFIVTGLVLLAAVIVDALSRRSQKQAGLA